MTATKSMPSFDRRKTEQELKSRASDATFGMKFVIYAGCLWYGIAASMADSLALNLLGILVVGAMFAHGVELQHQVLHGQGFRNRRINEIIGIVLGLPMLVSFAGYQASHLRHHRHLGTPENKEFFDYGDQYGSSRLGTLFLWMKRFLMPAHYGAFFMNSIRSISGKNFPGESDEVSRRIRRDHLIMLAFVTAISVVSVGMALPIVFFAWLIPLAIVAAPIHALIEMPEHYRCDVASTDSFRNTRTIKSNPVMTWFTNGNNFHVEHHLMPGLPIDRLHDLHSVISDDIENFSLTYRDFYRSVFFSRATTTVNQGDLT